MTELNRGSKRTKDGTARQWWQVAVVIVALLIFFIIWWKLPPLLYGDTDFKSDARLKAITDTRTALLAGLVVVGALLTFWQNNRMRDLTERGQITDRYAKAIDQLGSEKLDVRLGGIYALEQISYDSSAYQATIVEVLSAFVRVHSRPLYRLRSHEADLKTRGLASGGSLQQGGGAVREEVVLRDELDRAKDHVSFYPLPADVQAAMTVLGRLCTAQSVDLKGAYLKGVDLKHAHLKDAHLEGAIPEGTDLMRVIREGETPEKPIPEGANLEKALLEYAHLEGAILTDAHLEGANLDGAELEAADLAGAHLNGALLGSAKGLTIGQVKRAHCYSSATLPDNIRQQLENPAAASFESG